MVALDQMDGGRLDPKFVAGLLASTDPGLKEAASWIVGRHREWAGALAGVLGERLDRPDLAGRRASRAGAATRPASPRRRRSSSSWPLACATPPPRRAARRSSLQAMAWSGLKEKQVPRGWVSAPGERARRRPGRAAARSARRGDRSRLAAAPEAKAERPAARLLRHRRRRQESRRAPPRRPRRRARRPRQTRSTSSSPS